MLSFEFVLTLLRVSDTTLQEICKDRLERGFCCRLCVPKCSRSRSISMFMIRESSRFTHRGISRSLSWLGCEHKVPLGASSKLLQKLLESSSIPSEQDHDGESFSKLSPNNLTSVQHLGPQRIHHGREGETGDEGS